MKTKIECLQEEIKELKKEINQLKESEKTWSGKNKYRDKGRELIISEEQIEWFLKNHPAMILERYENSELNTKYIVKLI